jgi:hypothetical protein
MLVDDFITNFNKYQQRMFVPGSNLEAKKTIIQWYGIGGSYIDYGLLMYITRDNNPDNGTEIQNCANIASIIMLSLKIVKSV